MTLCRYRVTKCRAARCCPCCIATLHRPCCSPEPLLLRQWCLPETQGLTRAPCVRSAVYCPPLCAVLFTLPCAQCCLLPQLCAVLFTPSLCAVLFTCSTVYCPFVCALLFTASCVCNAFFCRFMHCADYYQCVQSCILFPCMHSAV